MSQSHPRGCPLSPPEPSVTALLLPAPLLLILSTTAAIPPLHSPHKGQDPLRLSPQFGDPRDPLVPAQLGVGESSTSQLQAKGPVSIRDLSSAVPAGISVTVHNSSAP